MAKPHLGSCSKAGCSTLWKGNGVICRASLLRPFSLLRCSWFSEPLSLPEPGQTRIVSPGACVFHWVRRSLSYHVEFISTVMLWVQGSTKNPVRRMFHSLHSWSHCLVGDTVFKWAQVLRKERKEPSNYRREEGIKSVLEQANYVWPEFGRYIHLKAALSLWILAPWHASSGVLWRGIQRPWTFVVCLLCGRLSAKCFTWTICIIKSSRKACEAGFIVRCSILQRALWRLRGVNK